MFVAMALALAGARTAMLAGAAVAPSALARCLPVDVACYEEEGADKDEIDDDFLCCHVGNVRKENLSGTRPSR